MMIKDTCDIPAEYQNAVQLSQVSSEDAIGLTEQWGIRKNNPYYTHFIACLQTDCGKCVAYILQNKL